MDAKKVFSVALKVVFNFRTIAATVAFFLLSFLARLVCDFDSTAAAQIKAASGQGGKKKAAKAVADGEAEQK